MTQEEKAKAYDEAVKRAKAAIDIAADKDLVGGVVRTILPEFRESEDEKIRKLLVWQVYRNIEDETNDLAQSVYDGIKGHDPDLEESIEDWKRCLAWLEKQKENPKSADSIPSDCASDAKCEDRWHKVSDSLPDNGRLVLANDCLGNTLLARYDGEGNWEVSVYDNEDYYCRNTITKWCEIPSEKQKEPLGDFIDNFPYSDEQKEQKPNIELIQRSWYMEGYNDRKFGNEPKCIIKTGEGGPKHELNPRYRQPLTERQVTEEQLHNLNEAIKSFRMDGFDKIADSLHSLYNILNTQEQKPAEWNANDKAFIKDCARILDENGYTASAERLLSMFEQKPVQDREEKEYVRTLKSLIADFLYGKDEIDRGYYQKIYDWLDGRHIKQEPEWSEWDEIVYKSIQTILLAKASFVQERKWFDSIKARIKSACWNEEDEKILDSLIRLYSMEYSEYVCPWANGDITYGDVVNFLKSLRPQPSWKPSEHQMDILKAVKDYVGKGSGYWGEALGSLIEDLEKL